MSFRYRIPTLYDSFTPTIYLWRVAPNERTRIGVPARSVVPIPGDGKLSAGVQRA